MPLKQRTNLTDRLRLALLNRRFRSLLLVLAIVPTAVLYLWQTLFRPIVLPGNAPIDFFEDYVASAKLLASGVDPYSPCLSRACWTDLANAWSLYPPVVSWLSLPLVNLDQAITGAVALIAAQLCVAIFIWVMVRALRIRDWQAIALWVLAAITFAPLMGEVVARNLQVLMLAFSAIWFAGWLAGDRWWGGVALGTGLALKPVQAPLLLLSIWFRRPWTAIAAVLSLGILWLLGAPQYLGEYLFRIVPGLNTGTGFAMNVSPVGAVARLFHPGSMYGNSTGIDTPVRVVGYAIAIAVTLVTAIVLRAPRKDRDGRALEAAVVVAATPLVVAVVRPGHLLLLLLPMMVLGTIALRRADFRLGIAVAVSWVLIGPVYLWLSNLLAAGVGAQFLRPGAETALAGAVLLWLAALHTLRRHRVAEPVSAPRVRAEPLTA
jgi:arabinofuranan 3-O-arabinosyltransferase